jgi:hypothetical protein
LFKQQVKIYLCKGKNCSRKMNIRTRHMQMLPRKSILVYRIFSVIFLISALVGCTSSNTPALITSTATEELSAEVEPELTSQKPTLTTTNTPTIILTDTPTSTFGAYLTDLDVQDENIHYLAYKQGCDIPPILDLENVDLDCVAAGLVTQDAIVFSEISQFKLLRVGYELESSIPVPETFIENTLIKVYTYDLEADFNQATPLLETSLLTADKPLSLIFVDLDLAALQASGSIAFYIVVWGEGEQLYRVDKVIFDDAEMAALTESGIEDIKEGQPSPTLPAIPSPTRYIPPPTATDLPQATRTPKATATRTATQKPKATATPTETQIPTSTVTSIPTLPPPTATQVPPTSTATPQHSPTVITPLTPSPTRTPTREFG